MEGIDTRALVRRLRVRGAMNGVLSTTDLDNASLVHKARTQPGIVGRDLVREVVPPRSVRLERGLHQSAGDLSAVAAGRRTTSSPSTSA